MKIKRFEKQKLQNSFRIKFGSNKHFCNIYSDEKVGGYFCPTAENPKPSLKFWIFSYDPLA